MPTPLEGLIRRMIAVDGPMRIDRFMALCLSHPEHGYYMRRDPFGVAGDFTTAPEISQMFGELIGLWLMDCWQRLSAPSSVHLIELGPGRGTLMADILRVAQRHAAFHDALDIHLIETSPTLRALQQGTLKGHTLRWHERLEDVPDGPSLIIGNEFLDCLPIRQFVMTETGWRERLVSVDGHDALAFGLSAETRENLGDAMPGTMHETSPTQDRFISDTLAPRLAASPGIALFLDYGPSDRREGDSLQALKAHRNVSPLETPGECDVTAHVQFGAIAEQAARCGLAVHGPISQSDFLLALGLATRADRLANHAKDAGIALSIRAQFERLVDNAPQGMGRLFKAIAITSTSIDEVAALPLSERQIA
jgi:NADH dehydrogenase [ubiquinone] 1 alpha subcomplex assembly factor 7